MDSNMDSKADIKLDPDKPYIFGSSSEPRAIVSYNTTKLPYQELKDIFEYAAGLLKAISWSLLQIYHPGEPRYNEYNDPKTVPLSWACEAIIDGLPLAGNYAEVLRSWLPVLDDTAGELNNMSSVAACETIEEAAYFATETLYKRAGRILERIAAEMRRCRRDILGTDVSLDPIVLHDIDERLNRVLKEARRLGWGVKVHEGKVHETLKPTEDEG